MAEKVKQFFNEIEAVWGVIPGYIKAFLYSFSSSGCGLWGADQLDWKAVAVIVASNIGIYSVPRIIGTQTRKML